MKKILLILLLVANIYATSTQETEHNTEDELSWSTLMEMAKDINSSELYKQGSAYIDEINTQENRDKAVAFYEKSKEKISSFSVESIKNMACSSENEKEDTQSCNYWKNQERLSLSASENTNTFCTKNSPVFSDVKATDIKMQELEALFLGLCQKVKLGDLTSAQAEEILQKNRSRLGV